MILLVSDIPKTLKLLYCWAHVKQLFKACFKFLKRTKKIQPPPWRSLYDCDWRRWGVAFPIVVIRVKCLLGLCSGNASPCGCCWGTLLRTGQLSPRLTRRLWRTRLQLQWLTGTPVPGSVKACSLLHGGSCPPWPNRSWCFHTSRLWCTDGPQAGEILPTSSEHEGDGAHLVFTYNTAGSQTVHIESK